MCAKKKVSPNKIWKLAGKLCTATLMPAERKLIAEDFFAYKRFRGVEMGGLSYVTPAMARIHESAAQAVAGFLCQHYAGRFERSSVVRVVSATAAIPANLLDRTTGHLDFLMGRRCGC